MQGEKLIIRAASHAGSWYTKSKTALIKQLQQNLSKTQIDKKISNKIKAIIGPHAGYRYSGPCAAWSYKYLQQIDKQKLKIFLLGPSHHKYLKGVSISSCHQLQTPLGNLPIDLNIVAKLNDELKSTPFSKKEQQRQHSLQMHMPYIKKTLEDAEIIPIIVGECNLEMLNKFGKILAPYFDQQNTIFVISSDFCHWGEHLQTMLSLLFFFAKRSRFQLIIQFSNNYIIVKLLFRSIGRLPRGVYNQ